MDRKKHDGDVASQHARFLETVRALGCNEDEAAFDEKLKAALGSDQSTDTQVLDALNAGLELGDKKAARSQAAVAGSLALIAKVDDQLGLPVKQSSTATPVRSRKSKAVGQDPNG